MNKTGIEVRNLQVAYQKTLVLKQLSLEIERGKITGVIGPNGSGKTTFLKAVLDLIPTVSGEITFEGKPLNEMRKEIAYVPQRESVDWDFPASVNDIVSMGRFKPSRWWQRLKSDDKKIVEQAIEKVNLTSFRSRQIGQLSGGQQQRVFLARALAQEASVIFMDEPFAGVDTTSQEAILKVLRELKDQGKTIIIVHHDLSTVAEWFDNVILLNNRLVASGTVEEVMKPEILAGAYGTALLFRSEK